MNAETEDQAARWLMRCDRELNPAEQAEFLSWMAANPSHGDAFSRHRENWCRLDRLTELRPMRDAKPNPDLLAPAPKSLNQWWPYVGYVLAAAAVVVVGLFLALPQATVAPSTLGTAAQTLSTTSQRVLSDGSTLELKQGATVEVQYTASTRHLRLDEGEVHFHVSKDPLRPFIVEIGGVFVRAVGTAFNVRRDAGAVEILVTEGRVQIDTEIGGGKEDGRDRTLLVPMLSASQRVVVSLVSPLDAPRIDTLTPDEIESVLSWRHGMLDFTDAPLVEVVAEFNRHNTVQLVIDDPTLAAKRISATFQSDNVNGFVSLLEAGFNIRVVRRGSTIHLQH